MSRASRATVRGADGLFEHPAVCQLDELRA